MYFKTVLVTSAAFLLASLPLSVALQLPFAQKPIAGPRIPTFPKSYGGKSAGKPAFADFSAPEQSLSALSEEYTTLSHPAFSGYGVRVKRTKDFCDTSVNVFTGYLDVDYGAKHLFFYFFESRSDPDNDDLLMWINGGPGCSSALGLFMELGPCLIDAEGKGKNGTVFNPFGWNDKANLFFLDQPVGVGFSYADYGETIATTEDAAKNVAAFMYIFTETFAQFKGRAFHMSGESYGGRYLPVFASEIMDQNKLAVVGGFTPINLQSVLIGNGMTDIPTMVTSYFDMTCTRASVDPVLDISTCVRMQRSIPLCKKMMQEGCIDVWDELACTAALRFCESEISSPFFESGRNPYDISIPCDGPISETLCYPITSKIGDYLNRLETRSLIGVDPKLGNFSSCSSAVGYAFEATMDVAVTWTTFYITGLLERGIDVLIYVGDYDWICNWVGNSRWVEALEWHGQEEYNSEEFGEWTVDGEPAGIIKSAKGLTFATIHGAGHMVPYDKPVQALAMLNRWIASRKL